MSKRQQLSQPVGVAAIAARCEVSAMTVSRVLRGDTCVAEGTRKKVLDCAAELGYSPRRGRGRPGNDDPDIRPAVEVILGASLSSDTLFYSQLLSAMELELAANGYDCLVRGCTGEYDNFILLLSTLRKSEVAGSLILGHFPLEQLESLLDLRPAAVLVDHSGDPRLQRPYGCIGFDNCEAARLAIRHLHQSGRRRIALLKGFVEHYFSREIEQGYREVLSECGLPLDEALILNSDFSAGGAYGVMGAALAAGLKFDALFTNDEMAFGALRALAEAKRRVPRDVAVCGCDGLPLGEYTWPPLTTVALDYRRLGALAVEQVLAGRDPARPLCRIRLVPELVVRQSSS